MRKKRRDEFVPWLLSSCGHLLLLLFFESASPAKAIQLHAGSFQLKRLLHSGPTSHPLQSQSFSDISVLCSYIHLQKLEVPRNQITGDFLSRQSHDASSHGFTFGCFSSSPRLLGPARSLLRQSHAVPRHLGRVSQRNRRLLWIQAAQELEGKRRKTLKWNGIKLFPPDTARIPGSPSAAAFNMLTRH